MKTDTLLYHAPCFDGLISAVVASDHLEHARGWSIGSYVPVLYDKPEAWLWEPLPKRTAIVDFLYHPSAQFWVDHHQTTFLTEMARRDYEACLERGGEGRTLIYDQNRKSGAGLLWDHVKDAVSAQERLAEMVAWAERTDSATYDTVEQAVYGHEPALRIAHGLGQKIDAEFLNAVIAALRSGSIDEVAASPMINDRYLARRGKVEEGMEIVNANFHHTNGGLGTYEATLSDGQETPRYGIFLVDPDVEYSISLVHSDGKSKISASQNPWRRTGRANLGSIFRKYDGGGGPGGGHAGVGAILIKDGPDVARQIYAKIVTDIEGSLAESQA